MVGSSFHQKPWLQEVFTKREVKLFVVHSAATTPKMDVDAAWIERVHRTKGFFKIGYHFFIKRDGSIEVGRELDEVGAHVKGHNRDSVGICMAGGLSVDGNPENNFEPEQFAALKHILELLHDYYPEAEACGHRDIPGTRTVCPSFNVDKWLSDVGLSHLQRKQHD